MNKIRKYFLTAIVFFVPFFCFADLSHLFNEKAKKTDIEKLEKENTILRSIGSIKKIIMKETPKSKLVIEPMRRCKSGYMVEIINVRPYEGNEDLIERINVAVSDVLSYEEIPFYDARNKNWEPLYDSAELVSSNTVGNKTVIIEKLTMKGFGDFKTEITLQNFGEYFVYRMRNLEKLKYKGFFTVCDPGEMDSVIAVYRDGDNWVVYAIGGANIMRVPIVSFAIEPEFTGRVKAFSDFVFAKIEKLQKK
ncbi:DUF6675 family protein [Treponema zioleckii]|uniref:DUF6675 family protein n=1 Tax=Treponema zioleckii TaxID=331680 RepID=UPI00168A8AE3|nr:DUF6675 family protein [Treponema zioleckii]